MIEKFNGCGDIGDTKPKPRGNIPPEDVQAVKDFSDTKKEATLGLGMSVSKTKCILSVDMEGQYVPKKVAVFTLKQKQTRLEAARWFLLHDLFAPKLP